MTSQLRKFLVQRCSTNASARMPLVDFINAFRADLPNERARANWTRSRIVAELVAAGFPIGQDQKVYWLGGLSLRGTWKEKDGAMVLELSHSAKA